MITLSITMIIKNEELTLERILSQLSFADELIIVDTGSEDNSINIAKKYTDKVFSYTWQNDFSSARNFAISKATKEYFMWLDADDVIKDEEVKRLQELKKYIQNEDIIMLPYVIKYGDQKLSFYRERIIKNNGACFEGKVHEAIPLKGNIRYEEIPIYHEKIKQNAKERNLNIYKEILKQRNLDVRETYYYGNELLDNNYLDEAEKVFLKFLTLNNATNYNKSDSCLKLVKIYQAKNNHKKANEYCFKSLQYGINSSLQLFNIILYYYQNKDYVSCELFAKILLNFKENPLAFSYLDNKDYYAYIYLSLCAYYQGDKISAKEYNEDALKIKPNDPLALKNQKYY